MSKQIKIHPFVSGQLLFVPIVVAVPASPSIKVVRRAMPSTKTIAKQFTLFLGL